MQKKLTVTVLEAAYQRMAQDEAREAEALEFSGATIMDAADETRFQTCQAYSYNNSESPLASSK
jgi:hypothetical protein